MQHRISDYGQKYPRWLSRGTVWAGQARLQAANDWLSEHAAGLGQADTTTCFAGLAARDLTPGVRGCRGLGGAPALVQEDFWGHPRTQGRNDRGALDFHASRGNLRPRRQRLEHGNPPADAAR
ncbi:MAG: hypothetical protein EXR83_14600 [Gammaproteobacteria bacterium]|nr:hypothetical protein [Gammaproteobacteria bacterium]